MYCITNRRFRIMSMPKFELFLSIWFLSTPAPLYHQAQRRILIGKAIRTIKIRRRYYRV